MNQSPFHFQSTSAVNWDDFFLQMSSHLDDLRQHPGFPALLDIFSGLEAKEAMACTDENTDPDGVMEHRARAIWTRQLREALMGELSQAALVAEQERVAQRYQMFSESQAEGLANAPQGGMNY